MHRILLSHLIGGSVLYLEILDNRVGNVISPDLTSRFQSSSHHRKQLPFASSINIFHGYRFEDFTSLVLRLHEFRRSTRLAAVS